VRETFGLHELAVEDALTMHWHPKLVTYDGVQLVIVRTARYDDDDEEEVDFGEISVFVAPTYVITVRQGVATDLTGVRQRLEERPELRRGRASLGSRCGVGRADPASASIAGNAGGRPAARPGTPGSPAVRRRRRRARTAGRS
jgi:hypothetical protein